MMVHTPDCASLFKVRPLPWQDKIYNATLVGNTWEQLYPLRATMAAAIEAGRIPGAELMPHPGCASSQGLHHTETTAACHMDLHCCCQTVKVSSAGPASATGLDTGPDELLEAEGPKVDLLVASCLRRPAAGTRRRASCAHSHEHSCSQLLAGCLASPCCLRRYWQELPNMTSIPVAGYEVDSPLTSSRRDIYSAFVTRLQQSRICMFDSSVLRKSIAK